MTGTGLTVFESPEFGRVRTVEQDGRVLFCGRDVATALGYRDPVNALKQHCRGVVIHHPVSDRLGRVQEARFITEGDLYRLVVRSSLPQAERFERWVFDEVLPAVRRHGGYLVPDAVEAALTDPDFLIRLATALKEERASRQAAEQRGAELEARLEAEAPHARFGRLVSSCEGDLLVGQVAALITQGGLPVTQVQLFAWLRGHGWLCRGSDRMWNMPTKWALEHRYLRFAVTVVATGHGTRERTTPYVTGPGQQVLTDGFLTGRYALIGGGGSS